MRAMSVPAPQTFSTPPAFWRLAWRSLWRDVRAGELRLLFVALTLAVAALSAVAFFSSRLDAVLRRDAAQLLAVLPHPYRNTYLDTRIDRCP